MYFYKQIRSAVFTCLLLACSSIIGKTQQAGQMLWSTDQKIYVHTDKEEYLAGELIWFKTYLVDAVSNKQVNQNSVVYVELLNNKARPVLQAKIATDKSRRDGCFYLPVDLSTGYYTLTAYTTEMKSATQKMYFKKKINIINTLKPFPVSAPAPKASQVFFGLYPEGGSVVNGMPAKFAFYVMSPSTRKGLNSHGVIVNQKSDTVATFSTLEFGMGQIRFTPVENEKYSAIIHLAGDSTIRKEISIPGSSNYSLAVEGAPGNKVKVTVLYSNRNKTGDTEKTRLLMHIRETAKAAAQIDVSNGKSSEFFIDRSTLGTGVTYFTLFDSKGQPVCERLFYIPPTASAMKVDIALGRIDPGKRDSLNIGLNFDGAHTTDTVNGSMAVIPVGQGTKEKKSSIYEYLLLGADLPGEIENPSFYFTEKAVNNPAYIENLMMVNGWRQFSATAGSGKSLIRPIPENHGHVVTARVSDTWTNSPRSGVYCTLTTPSSPFGFYTGISDSSGMVRFSVLNYLGPGTIILKANSNIKPNPYKIEAVNPFDEQTAIDSSFQLFELAAADSNSLTQRSLAMQSINTFQQEEINRFIAPALTDTFPFFGKPEFSYDLDRYTRFSTMEEVLREYVTPITVAMKNSRLTLAIYNEKLRVFYPDFMLVLLDGVPLTDPHQIFNYNPYKVKKIDIVPRRYLYGSSQYYGIASFETYTGQFDATELDPSSVLVDYEGVQLKREFYSPVYTNEDKGDPRVPDLRSTLLWIPNIDLVSGETRTIKSYTSDLTGPFKIIFCGVTASGVPVQTEAMFNVK